MLEKEIGDKEKELTKNKTEIKLFRREFYVKN
jgi:hypothetical protein